MWVERWNLCRLKCKNLFFVTSTWLWFMWLLFNSFCSWQMMPIWLYWNLVLWLSTAEVQHCDARVGSNCLARTCLNVANQRRGISTWCTNTSCPRDWGRTELCRILCCWQQVPCWARCSSEVCDTLCLGSRAPGRLQRLPCHPRSSASRWRNGSFRFRHDFSELVARLCSDLLAKLSCSFLVSSPE